MTRREQLAYGAIFEGLDLQPLTRNLVAMSDLKANALVIKSAAKGPRATCTIEGHPGLDLQACQSARNFAPSIALIFRRPGPEMRSGAE
jgi:hypothetical protein